VSAASQQSGRRLFGFKSASPALKPAANLVKWKGESPAWGTFNWSHPAVRERGTVSSAVKHGRKPCAQVIH